MWRCSLSRDIYFVNDIVAIIFSIKLIIYNLLLQGIRKPSQAGDWKGSASHPRERRDMPYNGWEENELHEYVVMWLLCFTIYCISYARAGISYNLLKINLIKGPLTAPRAENVATCCKIMIHYQHNCQPIRHIQWKFARPPCRALHWESMCVPSWECRPTACGKHFANIPQKHAKKRGNG